MAESDAAAVFRAWTRLGHVPLDRLSLRTASTDGHHVAKVHGRYGIVAGLVPSVDGSGRLVVSAGEAYSPCGRYVRRSDPVEVRAPRQPGGYLLWLGDDATITARPLGVAVASAGRFLPLGRLRAVPVVTRAGTTVIWSGPVELDDRPRIPQAVPPQIGAGRERLGLQDIVIDARAHTLTRQVNTVDARFARPPLYFATIAVQADLRPIDLDRVDGWFTTICAPTAASFTLTVFVDGTDGLFDELLLWQFVSSDTFSPVDFDLIWIGVDPRRPGVEPADLACSDRPPAPPPELG